MVKNMADQNIKTELIKLKKSLEINADNFKCLQL